jgi:hypothetical protein
MIESNGIWYGGLRQDGNGYGSSDGTGKGDGNGTGYGNEFGDECCMSFNMNEGYISGDGDTHFNKLY